MKHLKPALYACLLLMLAACGGGGHLSVENPGGGETLELEFPPGEAVRHRLPLRVSGGIPPYETSIEGCPEWVSLFPDQGVLAGTRPAADIGRTFFCTYRVTESNPGFRARRSVDYGLRLTAGASGSDLSLPRPGRFGLSVGNFHSAALPAASGGVRPYRYALTCVGGALPPGMAFGAETRTFSGTPEAPFRDSCTYSVTDSSVLATTISQAVEIEVAGPVTGTLTLGDPPRVDLSVGTFRDVPFPAASGGVEPYTYDLACAGGALPSGMSFAPATRRLAGTPDTRFRDSCTYSVTDSSAVAATVSRAVRIEVAGPLAGPLRFDELPEVDDLSVGSFHGAPLPAAAGGVEPYTYSFTCAGGSLPSGMSFAPATRAFAGTPGTRFRDSCTYSVTDSSTPAATVSVPVEIEVAGPVTGTLMLPRPGEVDLSVGAFHDTALPAAAGGVEPYTYALTCAGGSLPSGMSFAPATRRLAGTPNVRFRDSCTYSVTDSSATAATVSRAVRIEVAGPLAGPLRFDDPPEAVGLSVGMFHSAAFPAATGGVEPYAYSFACAGGSLPSGMSFAPATRTFAGTPGTRFRDSCTYSVTDSSRPAATVSVPVAVEVAGPVTGTLMLEDIPKVTLSVGTFHGAAFPAATGGVQPYAYSFACAGGALPPGMGFAPATRTLAGTPDARFRDFCTYSVTDRSTPAATVSVPVEIEVAGPVTGTLMLDDVPKVELTAGTFHDEPLPAATGGVQPYTYSFACAGGSLPSGMGFAAATRRFAGTPEARFRDSCTYSVTDNSRTAATISVPVEVEVTGGATPLELPRFVVPGNVIRLRVDERARITFQPATEGVQPYTYRLQCPDHPPIGPNDPSMLPPPGNPPFAGLGFGPLTRVLSGTPTGEYTGPDCTYSVTDSATPPATLARSVALIIEPERTKWRFPDAERSLTQDDERLMRDNDMGKQPVHQLPEAEPGSGGSGGTPVYRLLDDRGLPLDNDSRPLAFNAAEHKLEYVHPEPSRDPPIGKTSTYRYQVLFGDTVDDTLCIDVSYRVEVDGDDETEDPLFASVRIHDNAFWNGMEFQCPPVPLRAASASLAAPSNPVHEALGPVHARRALDVAHGAVRDSVRGWTPGAPRVLTAIVPTVGIGSLSGESDGFDYTGSSESVSAGAEIGSGSWQAGLVGSYTRTELHYRAAAGLAERGYRAGEHTTEILSLHPFAAWHMPSGGSVWTSLGAGAGKLSHRDDLGFPSWSRSDVQLRAYAAGGSVPVADILSGELEAEAGIEAFAFEIEGGDRISSELPTLRGRDYRAGLAWSAPVKGAPSLSVAYKHLTGDGPEGGQLEAKGSVSVDGILDPRLSLISTVEGAFGLGDYEHESWGLSGGVRFAPGADRRGLGLKLDTRLVSPDGGGSADMGLRGEAGYGLRGWPLFPTLRPFVGVVRYSGDGSLRRSLGIDLRDTPGSRVRLEAWDRPRHRLRAFRFSLRHRF